MCLPSATLSCPQLDHAKEHVRSIQHRMTTVRDKLTSRVIRTCLLHGRDKLLAVMALRRKSSVRVAFHRWFFQTAVKRKVAALHKQRYDLQVGACVFVAHVVALSCLPSR